MKDMRISLLKRWADTITHAAQSGSIGGRPLAITAIEIVNGPRAAALEIHCAKDASDAGRLLKALSDNDCAMARQFVPFDFTGAPSVYMNSRYVRCEAGWPSELSETAITVSSLGSNPQGSGRWIAGKNESGKTITLGLSETNPHWLIGGSTGSGKTWAMRSAAAQLSRDPANRLILIDLKYGSGLGCLANIPNLQGPLVDNVDGARAALSWALTEMRQRYEKGGSAGGRIVIFVDEIQELTGGAAGDLGAVEMIRKIAAQGRGANIHLVLGTQHPVNDVFQDNTIRRNLTGRLALRVADYKASEVVVGASMPRADRLLGSGDSYCCVPGAVHRAQLAYLTAGDLEKLPRVDPVLSTWPAGDLEAIGNIQDKDVPGAFSGAELGVSLVTAHVAKGRPFLKEALTQAGVAAPGNGRADRLLKIGRETHSWLIGNGFTLCEDENR